MLNLMLDSTSKPEKSVAVETLDRFLVLQLLALFLDKARTRIRDRPFRNL